MRTRSLLLAALVAALLALAAVPAGAAGPAPPSTWGGNRFGELDDGTTTSRLRAGPVAGLAGAVQVAAGHYHSLAVLGDGTARAWGPTPTASRATAPPPAAPPRCRSAAWPGSRRSPPAAPTRPPSDRPAILPVESLDRRPRADSEPFRRPEHYR